MRRILIAAALIAALVAPGFSADAITQVQQPDGTDAYFLDFEEFDAVSVPEVPESPYTHSVGSGTTSLISGNRAFSGSQSWKIADNNQGGAAGAALINWQGTEICDGGTVEWRANYAQLPQNTVPHFMGLHNSHGRTTFDVGNSFGMMVSVNQNGGVAARLYVPGDNNGVSTGLGLTLSNDTWYHFRMSDISCTGTKGFTLTEITSESQVSISLGAGDAIPELDSWVSTDPEGQSSTAPDYVVYIDDLEMPFVEPPPPTEINAQSWCPDPGAIDYGYNYLENVVFAKTIGFDLQDGYMFKGDQNDEAFAFKVWNHETRDVSFHATLEADVDGQVSEFYVYFFGQDPQTWLSGDSLTASAKGNGNDDELLANSWIVRFEEINNDWRIAVLDTYGGERIQKGQAWTGGSPNKPTSWIIRAQTGIGVADAGVEVYGPGNVKVLDIFPTDQDRIWGVGLIGQSNSNIAVARTVLNNDEDSEDTHNSSCFFFNDIPEGDGDFVGSTGAIANNQDNTLPDEPVEQEPGGSGAFGTGGVGDAVGLSDEAMGWFFGIIFTVMVTFGLAQIHPVLIVPGVAVGIGGAVAFSYLPLWLPVFIVLLAAAVIVLRMKGGGG